MDRAALRQMTKATTKAGLPTNHSATRPEGLRIIVKFKEMVPRRGPEGHSSEGADFCHFKTAGSALCVLIWCTTFNPLGSVRVLVRDPNR